VQRPDIKLLSPATLDYVMQIAGGVAPCYPTGLLKSTIICIFSRND
jgi:hypothetical protein